jgi:predicted nucleic acid-binding protein
MRTALDTNVISALLSGEPVSRQAVGLMGQASSEGGLVVCGAVYAELLAYPQMTREWLEGFLKNTSIDIDFELEGLVWLEAGLQYAEYAKRRRSTGGSSPKRLLADFIIGAHAVKKADRLFTFDADRYRKAFPKLVLVP